ncbi:hypothetical protein GJ744_012298 [Endocarpon pusillum]|uniref:Uncharacterized protein n=1 Tax=Endocarpon pusillum TaxID=364733 RepID=A0A8H7E477_9EURO|nr:hypothetical protein GJ744_012298 [Endocarpon pusillum]
MLRIVKSRQCWDLCEEPIRLGVEHQHTRARSKPKAQPGTLVVTPVQSVVT